jgi:acyl-CoA thioesterase
MTEHRQEATGGADELARRVASAMFARDRAARELGIQIRDVGEGRATLSMVVRPNMLNGHAIAHGGFVFALADTAFAYACNSRNESTVALQCSISFARAAREGELLVAVAEERSRANRTATYDVSVTSDGGETVALFRGTAYRVTGSHV